LAVDGNGNLYVADYYLNTIRKGCPPTVIFNPVFTGGQLGFVLAGPTGQSVVVEYWTDLVIWLPIRTNSFADSLNFSDPQTSASPHCFTAPVCRGVVG
jgi:hypothetical protein